MIADRGRGPLRRRARDASRCRAVHPDARRSCSRRWPATCSATRPRSPSTRRPARCARRAAAIEAVVGDGAATDGDPLLDARRRRSSRCAARVLRRPARRRLRRPPRGRHRGAARVAAPLRDRRRAARRVPGRVRQGRHAERRGRGPHRRAHRRRSRSSPARSTRSSTRPRRSPSASRAPTRRCCRCRWCSEVLAAGAARDSLSYRALRTLVALDPAVDEVAGLHPLPHRGRPRRRRRDDRTSSTAAASRVDIPSRTDDDPRAARHQAPRRRRARGHRGARARATAARW